MIQSLFFELARINSLKLHSNLPGEGYGHSQFTKEEEPRGWGLKVNWDLLSGILAPGLGSSTLHPAVFLSLYRMIMNAFWIMWIKTTAAKADENAE